MPKIEKLFTLEITPERFVEACSEIELQELQHLVFARLQRMENMEAFKRKREAQIAEVRYCRVCGCTDMNCQNCIEKTGEPCYWVEDDLCSACVEIEPLKKIEL